jgi:hypothetical protein
VHTSPFLKFKTIPYGIVAGLRRVESLSVCITDRKAKGKNKNGFLPHLASRAGAKGMPKLSASGI